MRLIIILTAVSLSLAACSQGGSSDSASAPPSMGGQTIAPQPAPASQQIDYSKVTCSTIEECSTACDVSYPMVTEDFVRQSICTVLGGVFGPTSATCDSLVTYDQTTYISSNTSCKQQMVTKIISPKSIGAAACSTNLSCANYCSAFYVPTTDQAIERTAAANGSLDSGATLKLLIANHVVEAALAACLAAPLNFVLPGIN